MNEVFISRQPLVNGQSRIIATRLTLHPSGGATPSDAGAALRALCDVWPPGARQLFVGCERVPCDVALLEWPIPDNTTIEIHPAALLAADAASFVETLRRAQASLCLHFDEEAVAALAVGVPLRFIAFDARRQSPEQIRLLAERTQPLGIAVAVNVADAATFQACLDAGVVAAASWFFKRPGVAPAKRINPGQAQIIRLLNLVRNNADVKDIEAALKQDVTLSYKLLRYINSAGFGLSCEVRSFRHAVTILGYDKLNKWLSLLLVTASRDAMAPALMHTALARARLMEVLAQGLVDTQDRDNVFITGAFSMLDVLLGVSMETIVESMSLPEPIVDALLGRGGVCGPLLDLARLAEGDDGAALADQAAALGLSAERFNRAQLQALSFADAMEL